MKTLISTLVGIATFAAIIFFFYPIIINAVENCFFQSVLTDWTKIIILGCWVITLLFALGVTIWISIIVGIIVRAILD